MSAGRLQWRYILRPILPPIITNAVFISVASWQGAILVEQIFNWPGLGELLIAAIEAQDVVVVTGAVTIFACLLGRSVLFLDGVHVLADPRVSLGSEERA